MIYQAWSVPNIVSTLLGILPSEMVNMGYIVFFFNIVHFLLAEGDRNWQK